MSCLLGKKGVTYQYITYFHMYGNGEENSYSTLHYYLAIEFKVPNTFFFLNEIYYGCKLPILEAHIPYH